MKPFKATGPDCIYSFFLKKIPAISEALREWTEKVLNGLEVPSWLIEGRTRLIPKMAASSNDPKDYHPIACLNTIYKLLTSTINLLLVGLVDSYGLMPIEQRSMRAGSWGTMDCLVLDQLITSWAKVTKKTDSRLDRLQESL